MKARLFTILCIASATAFFTGCAGVSSNATAVRPQIGTAADDTAEEETASASTTADISENITSADNNVSTGDNVTGTNENPNNAAQAPENVTPQTQLNAADSTNTAANDNAATIITETQAKQIAFENAGITEDQIDAINAYLDYDDGIQEYNIEFYAKGLEYDYEINAADGTILSADREIDDDFYSAAGNASENIALTIDEARNAALARVPGAGNNHIQIETDYDHGRTYYEGEIHYNGWEYEFEIDGSTGQFIQWEQEFDD